MGQDTINILLAEDDEGIRNLLRIALQRHKYNVDIAADGAQAYAMAQQKPYDVVLTDTEMPGLLGYELSAQLAETGHPAAVIGMSANPDYRNRYAQFIFKPDIDFFGGYLPQKIEEALRKAA
jgi:DNA-binding response OmpR family regulator